MKNKTKLIFILGAAALGTLALGACAHPDTTYADLAEKGANVVITYDKNGGQFASREEIGNVRDVYAYEDVERGLKLLEPGDTRRGDAAAPVSTVTRAGYQFAGWYLERTDRYDEAGNRLDEFGDIYVAPAEGGESKASDRRPGYIYSGRWDFDKMKLTTGDLTEETVDGRTQYTLTFYAAWVPQFSYEYYVKDGADWKLYGTSTRGANDTAVPAWNTTTGALDYNGIPVYSKDGTIYSMTGLYLDEALTVPVADNVMDDVNEEVATDTVNALGAPAKGIPHEGTIDYEKGIGAGFVRKCYTTWRAREWFRIATPKQFSDRLTAEGGYEIMADLDFTTETTDAAGQTTSETLAWNGSSLNFAGVIEGNNYTVKDIVTQQAYGALTGGGLFGTIAAGAVIRDLKIENIQFTVLGTTRQDGQFGLLTGRLNEAATLENVTLTGTLHLGDLVNTGGFSNYTIGLVSGNFVSGGLSTEGIGVVVDAVQDRWNEEKQEWDLVWKVKATVSANGQVLPETNDDPNTDPNPVTMG